MRLLLLFGIQLCMMYCHANHITNRRNEEIERSRREAELVEVEDEDEDIMVEDEEGDHEAMDPDPEWYGDQNEDPDIEDASGHYLRAKQGKKKKSKNGKKKNKKNKAKKEEAETFAAEALASEEGNLEAIVSALGRQLMLQQLAMEERVRSEGGSGIEGVRVNYGGTRPYFTAHHTSGSVASIHDHANNIRTVGMGEFIGVLNGVEFRTRHNDYRLKQPHSIGSGYHQTEDIEFPEVPPEVLELETVEEQIDEMREFFKAFKDQNITHRDYRPYFPAVLCYLEGAWTLADGDNIDEPFDSDRHFIDAKSWFDLQEKIRFTSATGRKSQLENFAYLPTSIIEMVNGTLPRYAQWNYRIMCHKLSRDVPLNRFRPVDDIAPRFARMWTYDKYVESRGARFKIHDHPHHIEQQERSTFLDSLMYEIPGKDNYQADIVDDAMGATVLHIEQEGNVNAGKYHRYYKVDDKGAMGLKTRKRGFNDPNLFVALTTQKKIAPFSSEHCSGRRRNRQCETFTQRVSYAIPVEIIYLTPLNTWNPYNLAYKGEYNSVEGKTVYALNDDGQRRNGDKTNPDRAYNGSNSKLYYRTPAEFFEKQSEQKGDPADTTRNSVGVLDPEGEIHLMLASGTRIFIPDIPGVGTVRQRYPIFPVHRDGSSVEKQLSALQDAVMDMQKHLALFKELPPFEGVTVPEIPKTYTFYTSVSRKPNLVDNHYHSFSMSSEDFESLKIRGRKIYQTTMDNNHDHELEVKFNKNKNYFVMYLCGGESKCWDDHEKRLYFKED